MSRPLGKLTLVLNVNVSHAFSPGRGLLISDVHPHSRGTCTLRGRRSKLAEVMSQIPLAGAGAMSSTGASTHLSVATSKLTGPYGATSWRAFCWMSASCVEFQFCNFHWNTISRPAGASQWNR